MAFIRDDSVDYSPAIKRALKSSLENVTNFAKIRLSLAAVRDAGVCVRLSLSLCVRLTFAVTHAYTCGCVSLCLVAFSNAGKPFVLATYRMEGDGPLILSADKELETVRAAITVDNFPMLEATIQLMVNDGTLPAHVEQWRQWAKDRVRPAFTFFNQRLATDPLLSAAAGAFKAAKLFLPDKLALMAPTAATVDSLRAFPFLLPSMTGLKNELPQYIALAGEIADGVQVEPLAWWRVHKEELPTWFEALRRVMIVHVTSAGAERVFSMLQQSFGKQQDASLADYIEVSLMMQYNRRAGNDL